MRAVLDTNTLVSALLFSGTAARLVPLWQSGRLQLLLSRPILQEYLRVLAYPKFRLTPEEIRGLLDEVLPFVESVRVRERLSVVRRDPADDKFLECAVAGRAAYIITGDRDLRTLGSYRRIAIVTPAEFLDQLEE
jgi:putative PIN family toxin of toxin-antitoxin system